MYAGLTPVLEGRCVCRINSSPGGPVCMQDFAATTYPDQSAN